MISLYFSIGLIYAFVKVLYFSSAYISEIETRLTYSKTKINYLLLIIFTILWPLFIFYNLRSLALDLSIWYHRKTALRALRGLDKTFDKYNLNKDDYFKNMFKDIESEKK